jgi:hypothetical protein
MKAAGSAWIASAARQTRTNLEEEIMAKWELYDDDTDSGKSNEPAAVEAAGSGERKTSLGSDGSLCETFEGGLGI